MTLIDTNLNHFLWTIRTLKSTQVADLGKKISEGRDTLSLLSLSLSLSQIKDTEGIDRVPPKPPSLIVEYTNVKKEKEKRR